MCLLHCDSCDSDVTGSDVVNFSELFDKSLRENLNPVQADEVKGLFAKLKSFNQLDLDVGHTNLLKPSSHFEKKGGKGETDLQLQ